MTENEDMGRPRKYQPTPGADTPTGATGHESPVYAGTTPTAAPPTIATERVPLTDIAREAHARKVEEAASNAPPADDPNDAYAEIRRNRIPFGTRRQRLQAEQRPGFHRHWFNDIDNRMEAARQAGYAVVNDPITKKPKTQVVGTAKDGGPLLAYLMETPQQFYDEDFIAKQEMLNETDRALYNGRHNAESGDGRYVPKSTPINVRVERGMPQGR